MVMAGSDIAGIWSNHLKPALMGVPPIAAQFEQAAKAAKAMAGVDLNDLNSLKGLGLDPGGELGLALWPLEQATFVVYTTLSDGAKYKKTVEDVLAKTGGKVTFEKVGDAHVAKIQDMAVVIAPKAMYAVMAERQVSGKKADVLAVAKTIAGTKQADSIAALPDFQARVKKVGDKGHFRGWANVGALVKAVVAMEAANRAKYDPAKRGQELLEVAKKSGDKAAIKRAEERAKQMAEMAKRWQERDKAEMAMMSAIYGSMTTAAWNYTLDNKGIHGDFTSGLAKDSLLTKVIKPFKGMAATVKGADKSPMFLIHTATAKDAFMELMAMAAKADGDDLNEGKAELKKALGIDFDKDVLAAVGEEAGFVIHLDTAKMADTEAAKRAQLFDGALVLKLADEAKAKELAKKVFGMKEAQPMVKADEAAGVWTVTVPMFKPVHVTIKGGWLTVATDKEFHARAGGDGAKSFAMATKNAALKEVVGVKDAATVFALDQSLMYYLLVGNSARDWDPPMPEKPTAEQQKTIDEYKKVKAEVDKLRKARDAKQMKMVADMMAKIGTTAMSVSVAEGEMTVKGGQYTNAPPSELLKMGIGMSMMGFGGGSADDKLAELETKMWKLQGEINRPVKAVAPAPAPKKTK